jgi:hypothetical protein
MKHLAQIGQIRNPFGFLTPGVSNYTASTNGSGLFFLLGNLIKVAIIGASLYTLMNFLLAGFSFLGAGGEPKNIAKAWEKIWLSVVGLLVTAGSLLLAAIFGLLIFGDWSILIQPRIFTP